MAVKAELTTAITEDDLGVTEIRDKYSNIRNIFGYLEDRNDEEGDERFDKTIASMLLVESVKTIDWNNISEDLSDRIDKIYVLGRIKLRKHEGSYARVALEMRTPDSIFKKRPLAMIQKGELDLVLYAAIVENEG